MRDSNQNDGAVIILVGIIVLLILGGGGFYTLRVRQQAALAEREAMLQRDLAEAEAARARAAAEAAQAASEMVDEILTERSEAENRNSSPNSEASSSEASSSEASSSEASSSEASNLEASTSEVSDSESSNSESTDSSLELDLISFLAARADAISANDAEKLLSLYEPTDQPNVHWNGSAIKSWESLKTLLESIELDAMKFETGNVQITGLGRDVAMLTVSSQNASDGDASTNGAITWVLKKRDDQWKILHESLALPLAP